MKALLLNVLGQLGVARSKVLDLPRAFCSAIGKVLISQLLLCGHEMEFLEMFSHVGTALQMRCLHFGEPLRVGGLHLLHSDIQVGNLLGKCVLLQLHLRQWLG